MAPSAHFGKSSWMLTLVSLAVIVLILYLAKGVLVPLMVALLISFLLAPICDWLERRKVGRVPSVLVAAALAFTVLGVSIWSASSQMLSLAPKLPEYQDNIQTKINSLNKYVQGAMTKAQNTGLSIKKNLLQSDTEEDAMEDDEEAQSVRVVSTSDSPLLLMGGVFGSLLKVFGSAGIIVVLVVFFLLKRDDMRDRFICLVGGRVTVTTQAMIDATARVSRYLLVLLLINVSFGVCVGIGLYFIGLPNAMLLGFMATILRFIPYVGPWIAAIAAIGLSMADSPGWVSPLLTIGLFLVLEIVTNNVIEPWFYGKNTGVSPVAVLLAAIFWTWLWGPVGLLLATPLTVCLMVIGKHVPELSFLNILLGTEPVFELKRRIYQRLLAGDQEEAIELLFAELETRPLIDVYDSMLMPALAISKMHWHHGEFDENRYEFILKGMRLSAEELNERSKATQSMADAAKTIEIVGTSTPTLMEDSSKFSVLLMPAYDEADEIATLMLSHLLEEMGCLVHVVPVSAMVSERVGMVQQQQADMICISAIPPAAVMHTRYLYRRLRGNLSGAKLIVGLWDHIGNLNEAKTRIGCDPEARLVSSFADISKLIKPLIQLHREKSMTQPRLSPEPTVKSFTQSKTNRLSV